mmetsp:Transcript_17854/g.42190  ORF Transcript_17854/g.42190 Transcript_17854/m.42190 type:complete len:360 (-) Transcript_17854:1091-2170(-)
MSAKLVEMMQRMPRSMMDQGACSRDEPQPKLSPAMRMEAAPSLYPSWLSTKSALGWATSGPMVATSSALSYRSSAKAANPSPDRLIVLRNSLGMIMSVSMFWMSSGAATPLRTVNLGRPAASPPSEESPWEDRYGAGGSMTAPGLGRLSVLNTLDRLAAPLVRGSAASSPRYGKSRTSEMTPEQAAAAAMAGLIRCVRPPLPCRPSKLRLLVEAQRSCGLSLSGFIARHMLHPGSRQSNPASMRIRSSPSCSAWCLTRPEPGTTMAWTSGATWRPTAMAATLRMSSMRPLVQEPIKTLSTGVPWMSCPPSRPMYSRERLTAACLAVSCSGASMRGTCPVMGMASWGEVPHVTVGAISAA